MAVCIGYQAVLPRGSFVISVRTQVAVGLLLMLALAAKIWVKVQVTQLGYELAAERKVTMEYDMLRREMELELSVLMRPDNIGQLAEKRLKLQPLAPTQARRLIY